MIDFDAALRGQSEVIIDASVAVDLVASTDLRHQCARNFLSACHRFNVQLLAPVTFGFEADTALRKSVPREKLQAAFYALDILPVTLICDENVLRIARQRAREIAAQLDQPSVYDATYAALAERRGCDFWTADQRFANAAHQNRRAPDGATAPAFPMVRSVRN